MCSHGCSYLPALEQLHAQVALSTVWHGHKLTTPQPPRCLEYSGLLTDEVQSRGGSRKRIAAIDFAIRPPIVYYLPRRSQLGVTTGAAGGFT